MKSEKTAIVVIHGMGNQYPMQTITNFVNNFFTKRIYSSPESVTRRFDLRVNIQIEKDDLIK